MIYVVKSVGAQGFPDCNIAHKSLSTHNDDELFQIAIKLKIR